MDEKTIQKHLQTLREQAKERKFTQAVELIVNLKDINLKNPDEQVEFFMNVPVASGKKRVCAIVDTDLYDEAKKVCDTVISVSELPDYQKDKKKVKQLANNHEFFIAQANIMGKVAGAFGRVLGPRGKMPNPKAGCVVPPKSSLGPLYDRLQSTVRIVAKKFPVIQVKVGDEKMSDEDLAKNIAYFYKQIELHLPKERHNVRSAVLKLSMSAPQKVL